MSTPTTLRAELLREAKTFGDRFYLTMGDNGAGMTPYNPLQVGMGARLVLQADRNVNAVRITLYRVTDAATVPVGVLNPIKTSPSTWEVEGAIGGARLGFPQPVPSYHTPQCFELRVEARNRRKVDVKVYTFWVGEGVSGTIAECIDRQVLGVHPLIAGYDGQGWFVFEFSDNYAELFARADDGAFVTNDPILVAAADPFDPRFYRPGGTDFFGNAPAGDTPFNRAAEPPAESLNFAQSIERSMNRLRDGYGDQWRYRRITDDEKWWHGTRPKAPRGAPAATHPTLGTGIADDLNANPQVANAIGGNDPGPNIGYPAGLLAQAGIVMRLSGRDEAANDGSEVLNLEIELAPWLGTFNLHMLVGIAADWVGGVNIGEALWLQGTQPANLLCSALGPAGGASVYDAANNATWPAANTVNPSPQSVSGGNIYQFVVDLSQSGVSFPDDAILVAQAFIEDPGSPHTAGGSGYFGRLFSIDTLRSNAIRFDVL